MEDLVLPTKVDERLESNINATTRNNKSFQVKILDNNINIILKINNLFIF